MAKETEKGLDMTPETKAYLDTRFKRLEDQIELITKPMIKTLEDYRENFRELYIRVGDVETDVAILKDNKGTRQNNTGVILVAIGLILTAVLAVIGWIR